MKTPITLNYFFTSNEDKKKQKKKVINAILIEFDNIFKESAAIALSFTATKGKSFINDYFHKPVYSLKENFKEILLYLYQEDFGEICLNIKNNEFEVRFLENIKPYSATNLVSINYCSEDEYESGKEAIKELPYNEVIKEHCLDIFKHNKELLTAQETLNVLKSNLSEVFVEAVMHNEDNWNKDMYSLKENNVLEDISSFWEEYILNNPLYLDLKEAVYLIYVNDDIVEFRFTNGELIYRLERTSKVIYDLKY